MSARTALLLTLVLLGACASTPEPAPLDRALRTVEAFRQASPVAAEHLPVAAAWAVFSDTLDTRAACQHQGYLFTPSAAPRPVRLTCTTRPATPAGIAYHELVLLLDPADLAGLESGPLDLTGATHVDVTTTELPAPAARLVITTSRATILFDPSPLHQVLELAGDAEPR